MYLLQIKINNIIFKITVLFLLLIFLGCGNNTQSNKLVTNKLVDTTISGIQYKCENYDSFTKDGNFTCPIHSIVSFFIGNVKLAQMQVDLNNSIIFPSTLYSLKTNNITDNRLINFIRLLQSLDSDDNLSNGIDINNSIKDLLQDINIDLTQSNINLDEILSDNKINLISPNIALNHYIQTLKDYNITLDKEPYFYQQWYLELNNTFYDENFINENAGIHSNGLLDKYTGKGVKIAIIDDGLDINHEDLEGFISKTYDVSTHTTNVFYDYLSGYHGTAVTGIIGARFNGKGIKGIASNAEIMFLKYKEGMSDSETIELFDKANEWKADIINCSWGTYDVSEAVKDKIIDLANNGRKGKGTIIVFACGNDNKEMGNDESSIDEVISVGSTNKNNLRAWYSNYGEHLDVMAPGGYDVGITTLDPMGIYGIASINDNYILYNDPNLFIGTSASAPIVSGIIALMLEKNSSLTRKEVEDILKNNSDKIGDFEYINGRNDYYGYGKVNLNNIIQNIK